MLDSLFLHTFSIPIITTLVLFIKYYSEYREKIENKLVLAFLLGSVVLLNYDRMNYLNDNDRKLLQLILYIILYILLIYYVIYSRNIYVKYLIILFVASLILIMIETSIEKDKNILLILSTIILLYILLTNLNFSLSALVGLYILNIIIDSPTNEISV